MQLKSYVLGFEDQDDIILKQNLEFYGMIEKSKENHKYFLFVKKFKMYCKIIEEYKVIELHNLILIENEK